MEVKFIEIFSRSFLLKVFIFLFLSVALLTRYPGILIFLIIFSSIFVLPVVCFFVSLRLVYEKSGSALIEGLLKRNNFIRIVFLITFLFIIFSEIFCSFNSECLRGFIFILLLFMNLSVFFDLGFWGIKNPFSFLKNIIPYLFCIILWLTVFVFNADVIRSWKQDIFFNSPFCFGLIEVLIHAIDYITSIKVELLTTLMFLFFLSLSIYTIKRLYLERGAVKVTVKSENFVISRSFFVGHLNKVIFFIVSNLVFIEAIKIGIQESYSGHYDLWGFAFIFFTMCVIIFFSLALYLNLFFQGVTKYKNFLFFSYSVFFTSLMFFDMYVVFSFITKVFGSDFFSE